MAIHDRAASGGPSTARPSARPLLMCDASPVPARRLVLCAALLAGALLPPVAVARPHRAAPSRLISLAWAGDMTPGSRYGHPPHHGRGVFRSVHRVLASVDVATGNLEGTFGHGGASKCGGGGPNCFAFQAPAANVRALARGGFDVVNVANNHAFDFGPFGQHQTLAALHRVHVGWTGRPGQILRRRVHGVRVAFVGFAPYPWAAPLSLGPAAELVRRADRHADVVVAFMHEGAEGVGHAHVPRGPETYLGEFRGNPRPFTHGLIRAGADVVLGSGPHVLRGMESYRHRLIAYSLGNFLGWHNFSLGGALSLSGIVRVLVDARGRVHRTTFTPVRLVGPGRPVPGGPSGAVVRRLSREDFGKHAAPLRRRFASVRDSLARDG
jgi:poly-gamma-glutamate capsule biosynthesis protein CapA/YwtB (metallophosphatase superfamily)